MTPSQLKKAGVACLVLSAVLLFAAAERYKANADAVAAMNQIANSSPFAGLAAASPFGGLMQGGTGGRGLKPGMPAITTYSLLLAALSAIGGGVCLFNARKGGSSAASPDDR